MKYEGSLPPKKVSAKVFMNDTEALSAMGRKGALKTNEMREKKADENAAFNEIHSEKKTKELVELNESRNDHIDGLEPLS